MWIKARLRFFRKHGRGVRKLFRFIVLLSLVHFVILAVGSGQELVLDVTKASEMKFESFKSHCFGGSLGGGSDSSPPVLPFGLQIVRLNASTYKEGEEVTAELLLTNKTDKPIWVPSSLNPDLVYAEGCKSVPTKAGARLLFGEVSLTIKDNHGFSEALDGAFVYGLSDDPTTFLKLRPGKSLRLRTAGKVYLYNMIIQSREANIALEFPMQLEVTAKFNLDDPSFRGYRPLTSENRLHITLAKQVP
jgi:hypothetical protein